MDPETMARLWWKKLMGEIMIRGNVVMKVVLKIKKRQKNQWMEDGFIQTSCNTSKWLHKNTNRSKDIIISEKTISSIEIENTISKHHNCVTGSCCSKTDEKWGETLCLLN